MEQTPYRFLGPFNGKKFLILIDSSTKWLEVFEMPKTNATAVIKVLRCTFARFGLPLELVSDQGPPFTSAEFKEFLTRNGIQQRFSPAYHPSSNGTAENAVNICKKAIKKAHRESIDVDTALQTFLLTYRNSIHSSTGESPSMLLQKRTLRSRLDLLRSDRALINKVNQAQSKQVEYTGGVQRSFAPGEPVWVREYGHKDRWVKGTIVHGEGSRRYAVDKGDSRQVVKHVDQIKRRSGLYDMPYPEEQSESMRVQIPDSSGSSRDGMSKEDDGPDTSPTTVVGDSGKERKRVSSEHIKSPGIGYSTPPTSPSAPSPEPPRARSGRVRKPVVRFQV